MNICHFIVIQIIACVFCFRLCAFDSTLPAKLNLLFADGYISTVNCVIMQRHGDTGHSAIHIPYSSKNITLNSKKLQKEIADLIQKTDDTFFEKTFFTTDNTVRCTSTIDALIGHVLQTREGKYLSPYRYKTEPVLSEIEIDPLFRALGECKKKNTLTIDDFVKQCFQLLSASHHSKVSKMVQAQYGETYRDLFDTVCEIILQDAPGSVFQQFVRGLGYFYDNRDKPVIYCVHHSFFIGYMMFLATLQKKFNTATLKDLSTPVRECASTPETFAQIFASFFQLVAKDRIKNLDVVCLKMSDVNGVFNFYIYEHKQDMGEGFPLYKILQNTENSYFMKIATPSIY